MPATAVTRRRIDGGTQRTARTRVGLALAGGGPLGGIYEVGALIALADSLDGLDFNSLDVYVGVSSGGYVAAALANGISPALLSWFSVQLARPEAQRASGRRFVFCL